MPNIEDFSAGNIDIRPQEIGVESTAAAGRRLGAYGSQIAESYTQAGRALGQVATAAEQYLEHREINTGAAHGADLIAAKNQSWSDFITGKDIDPNDPARQDKINQRINNPQAGKQWREQSLEPDLQQFEQGFLTPGGRQWAAEFSNKYRLHMAEHTAADQSSMAGAVAQANHEKTENSLAVATFNDPSSLRTNLDLLTHTIKGTADSSPVMTPGESIKFSVGATQRGGEKLVQAAIQGAILKGGDWRSIASDPAYSQYVKPAENAQFERMEKTYQKGMQVADAQLKKLQKETAELDEENAMKQSFAKNVKTDDAGNVTIDPQFTKDMLHIAATSSAPKSVTAAERQIDWAKAQMKPPAVRDDPDTVSTLTKLFHMPNTTAAQASAAIDQASIDKKLTPHTEAVLRHTIGDLNNLKDPGLVKVMDAAEGIVDPRYPGAPRTGAYAAFYDDFINNTYLPRKRAGTLPDNALKLDDENSLISQAVTKFKPTLPQAISANGGVTTAPPVYTAPKRPENFPSDSQWDANGYWYVIRNGQKLAVTPAAAVAAPPTPPISR